MLKRTSVFLKISEFILIRFDRETLDKTEGREETSFPDMEYTMQMKTSDLVAPNPFSIAKSGLRLTNERM